MMHNIQIDISTTDQRFYKDKIIIIYANLTKILITI